MLKWNKARVILSPATSVRRSAQCPLSGRSRRFDRVPTTSALPLYADIVSVRQHASNVPITELMRRGKQHCSITSSAQTSNEGAAVRPSALATFKLITHLVFGRLLHRQVGRLSALRILST